LAQSGTIVPAGRVPEPEALAIGAGLDDLDFTALLADAGIVDRAAVAGVQDKVSARMISLPVAQAGRCCSVGSEASARHRARPARPSTRAGTLRRCPTRARRACGEAALKQS